MAAANFLRGEAELVADIATYTLTFDVNAFCLAEKALGQTTDKIVATVDAGGADLSFLRTLIWAGLQRHHDCTIAEAGDIVSDAGFAAAKTALMAGLGAAFGMKPEGEDRQDPPKASRGTGSRTSRGGSRPDKA